MPRTPSVLPCGGIGPTRQDTASLASSTLPGGSHSHSPADTAPQDFRAPADPPAMRPSFVASRMAQMLELMPAAALELDAHGVVLAANALALTLFGCRSDGLLGSRIDPYLPIGELLAYDGELASARLVGQRANGVPVVV